MTFTILVLFVNVFVFANQVEAKKELLSGLESSDLREILEDIFNRLDEKDRELVEYGRVNALQQQRIQELENQLNSINKDCDLKPATKQVLKPPMKQLKPDGVERKSRQNELEHPVAFYATLTNHTFHIGTGQPIIFDRVVTNVGQAYNHVLGAFIAPVSGVYVFSVTLFAMPGHTTAYNVMKNDVFISRMYLKAPSGNYETAAQTFILQLDKGDDVNVQNVSPDEAIHGYNYSTFSGFLLQQTFGNPAAVIG
ncbi:heavy metal-binding protein HIP-like [Mya arenaria]|uniref:heavy metal-binding protein HIP-like n=1 Tax=Mya arenaria TaxID=6604 RepID=UPI0022DFF045|nr:heavy metal-binding protein HIP-like [Mya arenaria]